MNIKYEKMTHLAVKLMKQRESENADGTKQNKGRQE
ncbi:hypothetical protein Tsp_13123, partial [Trichinella spiralis]